MDLRGTIVGTISRLRPGGGAAGPLGPEAGLPVLSLGFRTGLQAGALLTCDVGTDGVSIGAALGSDIVLLDEGVTERACRLTVGRRFGAPVLEVLALDGRVEIEGIGPAGTETPLQVSFPATLTVDGSVILDVDVEAGAGTGAAFAVNPTTGVIAIAAGLALLAVAVPVVGSLFGGGGAALTSAVSAAEARASRDRLREVAAAVDALAARSPAVAAHQVDVGSGIVTLAVTRRPGTDDAWAGLYSAIDGVAGEVLVRVTQTTARAAVVQSPDLPRFVSISAIEGGPSHVVTQDGLRLPVGAVAPGGWRIVRIAGREVVIEREGVEIELAL
ncbi:SctD/MshK family protein [Futiania mangrovi]|uniref:YscD/Y4YQ C-terminal domain-containing protein n=1 Tax=Futiania mangrovi TaxID=2959716 RepID=A0A9J6PG47_9PROT|nr:hypothetical protein [Futiania mangrovii]MCP1336792.1 hypothetical protein [Futiania mangrovii]